MSQLYIKFWYFCIFGQGFNSYFGSIFIENYLFCVLSVHDEISRQKNGNGGGSVKKWRKPLIMVQELILFINFTL